MALEPEDPLNAGVTLVLPAFQSPNYVAGSAGWAVFIDGSCEFNNGTFRGTIVVGPSTGKRIVIDSAAGTITMYNAGGNITGQWSATGQSLTIQDSAGTELLSLNVDSLGAPGLDVNPDSTRFTKGRINAVLDTVAGVDRGATFISSPYPTSLGSSAQAFVYVTSKFTDGTGVPLVQFSAPAIGFGQNWQNPPYAANWAGTTTFNGVGGPTLMYRVDAEDNLWLYGLFTASAGAANPVFTLPNVSPPVRPAASGWIFCQRNNGGTLSVGSAFISSSGNVDLFAGQGMGIAAGNQYFVNGKVPLGNIT